MLGLVIECGSHVGGGDAQINARQLAPPILQYRDRLPTGTNGNWDLRNNAFFKPAALTSYGIACFADPRRCGQNNPQDEGSLQVNSCACEGPLFHDVEAYQHRACDIPRENHPGLFCVWLSGHRSGCRRGSVVLNTP